MKIIESLPDAIFAAFRNELGLYLKDDARLDPVKFRFGSRLAADGRGYLFALSGNVIMGWRTDGSPDERELILVGFKADPQPVIEFRLARDVDHYQDQDMVLVLSLTAKGLELHTPFRNGPFEMHLQGTDGNFVVYNTTQAGPPNTPGKPVATMQQLD